MAGELGAVGSAGATLQKLEDCDYVKESRVLAADLGSGTVRCRVELGDGLFYRILGEADRPGDRR